ncbi:MAG: hypothetical protein HGA67_02865 [Candidatus Yonathbacteria bacterium]|nr:hypothetical protein [Candidatus Yonathbacteria bacterium]
MVRGLNAFNTGLVEKVAAYRKNKSNGGENMALCGFTEKMTEGLTDFNAGLVEHGLRFRSEKNGETVDQGIKRELSDMARLQAELWRIEDSGKRILTEGLVKYAMGFYLITREKGVEHYKETLESIAEYFRFMDDTYYSTLEGTPHDMATLAKLLNEKVI